MSDDLDPRIHDALRHLVEEIPDNLQPPPQFTQWLRTADSDTKVTPIPARRRHHTVTAATAAAAVAAVLLGFSAWNHTRGDHQPPPPQNPAGTSPGPQVSTAPTVAYALYLPADYPSHTNCLPGPTVTPTASPTNAGKQLWWDEDPSITDPGDDHITARGLPLHSPAFDTLTDVGGCVQAWLVLDAGPLPTDARPVAAVPRAHSRTTTDGLTEVYLTRGTTQFIAASANVSAEDLANTLTAAITP